MTNEFEGKNYMMIGVFALVVAFAALVSNQMSLVDTRNENNLARANLDSIKKALDVKKSSLEELKPTYELLKSQDDLVNSLTDQKQRVSKSIEELKKTKAELTAEFIQKVKKVRASSSGLEYPQMNLLNGQVLTGAKIKSVSDTELTVSHGGGVAKISFANLPNDLRKKFRVNMVPMIEIDKANALATPPPNVNPGGSMESLGLQKSGPPKMSEIRAQNTKLNAQLSQLNLAYNAAIERGRKYQALDSMVRGSGKIVTLHTTEIQQANQEATAFQNQMSVIQYKINELQTLMLNATPD
jgi:hypothetical protein